MSPETFCAKAREALGFVVSITAAPFDPVAQRREEEAGLLAEPWSDVLLEVERVAVRLGLVLEQRDDLRPGIGRVEDLAEGGLRVGLGRAGRLDRGVQVDRGVRRHGRRGPDVDAAASATAAAGEDRGRDGDAGKQSAGRGGDSRGGTYIKRVALTRARITRR